MAHPVCTRVRSRLNSFGDKYAPRVYPGLDSGNLFGNLAAPLLFRFEWSGHGFFSFSSVLLSK